MAARARATEWLPVRCGLAAGAAARAGGRGSAAKWRQVWGSAGGRRGRALGARTGWTHSARSSLASADGSEAPEVSPGVRLGQGPAVGQLWALAEVSMRRPDDRPSQPRLAHVRVGLAFRPGH